MGKRSKMKFKEIFKVITDQFGEIPNENREETQLWYNEIYLKATKETQKALVELFFHDIIIAKDDNDELLWNFRALENGYLDLDKKVRILFYEKFGNDDTNSLILNYMINKANENDIESILFLGHIYSGGINVEKDIEISQSWYKKAASLNNTGAQMRVGEYLLEKEKYTDALMWFEKAASLGKKVAYIKIARMYKNGLGVNKDLEKSKSLLTKALEKSPIKNIAKKEKRVFVAKKKKKKK